MIKTITSVGDSQGLILDPALMDLAGLKVGDQIAITVHQDGTLVLSPLRTGLKPRKAASTAKRLIDKNTEVFRRLA